MRDQILPTVTESALRGIACRCPRCGKGKLYAGFLDLRPNCEACGLDYAFIDTGDGPAIFIIMIAGAIVVGCALIVEVKYQPPFWLHAALWLPLILATTLLPLRSMKSLLIALQFHHKAARRPADRPRAEMIAAHRATPARAVAGFGIFTLVMVALFVGLGIWQLQRRVEKHALIAALTERLAAAPGSLPPPSQWSALTPARDEFRRVSFAATYQPRPGCDGLQFRLGGARRYFRSRHLGVPARAPAGRRNRRGQCRLRAEHDAGSQPAGSRGGAAHHRMSR